MYTASSLFQALKSVLLRSDYPRWRNLALKGIRPKWDERNASLGALITPGSSVLDLGAGTLSLRTHLPPGCTYQPVDLIERPGVIYADFNRGHYPHLEQRYDFVVCSGVLEYIHEPQQFLRRAFELGDRLLISYAAYQPGDSYLRRRTRGWVNHLSQESLESAFASLGAVWSLRHSWNKQAIYLLTHE